MSLFVPLLSVLLAAAPAPTPAARNLAIVRPGMIDEDSPALPDLIAAQLADSLGGEAIHLLPADEVARVAGPTCDGAACLGRLRDELAADFVVRATVTRVDRDYRLQLELIDAGSGAVIARSDETCELCGLTELRSLAASQAARIRVSLSAATTARPRLQVVSSPSGALVYVDDRLAGVTPFDHEVLAGTRRVRVTHDRYARGEREVTVLPGTPARLRFELRQTPATLRLRRGAWALLSLGLASVAGGVTLLALDDRCLSGDRPVPRADHHVLDTDWSGAGLLAAGTALATAGTVLLVRTRPRGGRTGLRLRGGPNGASLAVFGAF